MYLFSRRLLIFLLVLISHHQAKGFDDLTMTYAQFQAKYQKAPISPQQQVKRELIFYQNIEKLKKMLQEGCSYCGVTPFFDETSLEFKRRKGLILQNRDESFVKTEQIAGSSSTSQQIDQGQRPFLGDSIPKSLNWAAKGKVTSVKNQGSCGTCWSFATVAAIESSLILKGETLNFFLYEPDLSEQFILTCAQHSSCQGGYLQQAIDVAYEKGVPYENQVPYKGQKGPSSICSDTSGNIFYTSGGKARYSYYSIKDDQIIQLLQEGPLMISISADNWENYGGGVFYCDAKAMVNHAVLLVGYDEEKWIIKNQWGTWWGEDGYIYVTRNSQFNCKVGSSVHKLFQGNLQAWGIIAFCMIFFYFLLV